MAPARKTIDDEHDDDDEVNADDDVDGGAE